MDKIFLFFRTEEALNGSSAVSSIFGNQNIYGVLNALFFIVLLSIRLNYRNIINSYLFGVMSALSITGVFLSTSRNAILTLLVGLVFLIFSLKGKMVILRWLVLTFVIVISTFFIFIKYDPLFVSKYGNMLPFITKSTSHESIFLSDFKINIPTKVNSRLSIWKTGIQKFKERPLLGWGIVMSYWRLRALTKHDHLHNLYIETLVSNGALGIVLFLFLIGLWLSRLRAFWCLATVAALLVMFMFETFIEVNTWVVFIPWIAAMTTRDLAVPSGYS
jgi:O-antigen ligase